VAATSDAEKLYWLSYALPDEFLGVAIVPAESAEEAAKIARARGITPTRKAKDKRQMQTGYQELPAYAIDILLDSEIGVLLTKTQADAISARAARTQGTLDPKTAD
jgi:hypothetical protein